MKLHSIVLAALMSLVCSFGASSCSSAYYGVMKKFGYEKRDILVSRVKDGREAQDEAKQQFKDALEAFKSVANFNGGDLQKTYDRLQGEFEDSSSRVDDVKSKIASIQKVAKDLFAEWKSEIDEISAADLKAKSAEMLADTRKRYETLLSAMQKAESKMEPVLTAFKDRVLFLKHNLNAQAITSLQSQVSEIDSKVGDLVKEMEASIREADEFVKSMDANSK